MAMLYEQWLKVSRESARRIALRDLANGVSWTFRKLAAATEAIPGTAGSISFPRGNGFEFVLGVLRAWRAGQVVLPLEVGHPIPELSGLPPRNIVHLKTTSATTGPPRLVAFTAAQLQADVDQIVSTMGLRPEWPNLGVISLAHSYGFSSLVLPLLLHGIPLTLVGAALPEAVRRAAVGRGEFTLPAVPAMWRAWHEAQATPANVALAISAGAPLPLELEQAVYTGSGIKIHNFYGSTECGGIAYDSSDVPRRDAAMVGMPLEGVDVRVGNDGCLQIRGPAVGQAYWPEPAVRLRHGVFRTSDLAEIADGCVYLRGRAGDRINVAGRKVSPDLIERALARHPNVRDCLVFGVPCPEARRGEIIVACVSANNCLNGESLKRFALSHLADWQVPREWWFVPSLQVNGRGKISRAQWRQRYLETAQATGQVSPPTR